MSVKSIALAALFASLSLGASASEWSETPNGASLKSREAVRAEVQSALRSGDLIQTNEGTSLPAFAPETMLDRAAVRKDAADALRHPPVAIDPMHFGG